MPTRKKRILWICNHVTLMDAEVPLLSKLGFEVFVPKKFPSGSEFVSCKPGTAYDADLTIPVDDLALLNTIDFYEDRFPQEVIDAVNRNFDIAITAFYEKPLRLLVNHFPGLIFIRAFGLAGDASYWEVARESWGQDFIDRMQAIRNRLYFAAAYKNMIKVEENIFKENAVFLPLGLPENFAERLRNGYTGTRRQILFVCPKICAVPYYYNIYKSFKFYFKGFPYVIAGKPFGKINDRHILGYLPREEFDKVFCESRVMYYHSVEPRHLHYHPLEAMYANLPVVFMAAGMLGELTPKIKYPGAADSIWEARRKVRRILNNDRGFIRDVQDSQKELLDFFSPDYVKHYWREHFLPLLDIPRTKSPVPASKQEHVGIFLPLGYRGGTLHAFIQIAKMLKKCGYKVTAGIPHDYFEPGELYYPTILDEVRQKLGPEIVLRVFNWNQVSSGELSVLGKMAGLTKPLRTGFDYALMSDNIDNFCECDRWLFISDRFYKGAPLPLRPYSVMVYDYLQRYLPFKMLPEDLATTYIGAVRQADSVFVTNPATRDDMINYCGVSEKSISILPFEFDASEMTKYLTANRVVKKRKKSYIVWACNCAAHKNHVNILKALLRYYRENDGNLEVYLTGVDTKKLNPKQKIKGNLPQHILDFRELFEKNKDMLRKNVHFNGEMERYAYFDLVRGAEFLLLSSIVDNGAFGGVEAAFLGVPCASSDYPHMRYMADYFGLSPLWYNGAEISGITQAFAQMQSSGSSFREKLPSAEGLSRKSYDMQQSMIRQRLREAWL